MKKSHLLWKILVVVMIVSAMMATFIDRLRNDGNFHRMR